MLWKARSNAIIVTTWLADLTSRQNYSEISWSAVNNMGPEISEQPDIDTAPRIACRCIC